MPGATKTTSRHEDNIGVGTPGKDVDSYSFECPDCQTAQPVNVEANQKTIECIECHHKFDVGKLLDEEPKKDPPKNDKVDIDQSAKGGAAEFNQSADKEPSSDKPQATDKKDLEDLDKMEKNIKDKEDKTKGDPGAKTPGEPPKPPANKTDQFPKKVEDGVKSADLTADPTAYVQRAIRLLQEHEAGLLPCIENREALRRLEAALDWLNRRTSLREEQGVEGTERAHRSNL